MKGTNCISCIAAESQAAQDTSTVAEPCAFSYDFDSESQCKG